MENLTLTGGAINGTGNTLANVITGTASANTLDGGVDAVADQLIGLAGNDIYALGASSNDTVVEAAGAAGGVDTITSSITRSLAGFANVENLTLSGGAINGTGNTLANVITGTASANILTGGVDTVIDRLVGLAGNDTYVLGNSTNDVVVEATGAAGGVDTITSTANRSLASYANVENLTLLGTAAQGTGNTLINTIVGNASANLINGGLGSDVLTGGAGIDSFIFNTALSASNIDRITDFTSADFIRLENTGAGLFNVLTTGTLSAAAFKANTSGAASELDDRIIYETDTGKLFYDRDGTGAAAAVQFALLSTKPTITHADFLVI